MQRAPSPPPPVRMPVHAAPSAEQLLARAAVEGELARHRRAHWHARWPFVASLAVAVIAFTAVHA